MRSPVVELGRVPPFACELLLARAALSHLGLDTLTIEVGENRGHGGIQVCRNCMADLDRAIEGAGQWRVLNDRHPSPACFCLDLLGEKIAALWREPWAHPWR